MPVALRVQAPPPSQVGDLVPALTPHAVSVALPKWQDNVDYEEGEQRVKDAMTSGYPRFFIHHQIQQLADLATARFSSNAADEACILLPTETTARSCSAFLRSRTPSVESRVVRWAIESTAAAQTASSGEAATAAGGQRPRVVTVWPCFFPAADFAAAKQYWQHTGEGISSRVAERCLVLLGEIEAAEPAANADAREAPPTIGQGQTDAIHFFVQNDQRATVSRYGTKGGRYQVAKGSSGAGAAAAVTAQGANGTARPAPIASKERYSTAKVPRRGSNGAGAISSLPDLSVPLADPADRLPAPPVLPASTSSADGKSNTTDLVEQDEDVLARYVEERYGRNLDLSLAPMAKLAMRRRIAGVLAEQPGEELPADEAQRAGRPVEQQESSRGVKELTEDDVWLYPCGMNAIFHAHQLAMDAWQRQGKEVGKSVCFGFVRSFSGPRRNDALTRTPSARAASRTRTRSRFSKSGDRGVISSAAASRPTCRPSATSSKRRTRPSSPSSASSPRTRSCARRRCTPCGSSQTSLGS